MSALRRRGRLAAGLDVTSGQIRVAIVGSDDDGTWRVHALDREPVSTGAVERGIVRDAEAVERAARVALARTEDAVDRRADALVVATATDDLRAYRHVWSGSRGGSSPVTDRELRHAGERVRTEAAREAVRRTSDEPGLRKIALVPLQATAASIALDGRPLVAVGRQRGAVLDVELVVPLLPLAQSAGLEAAVQPLGRETRFVAAPLAVASLVAGGGVDDAIVVDIGADITGVAVLRDGAPIGARAYSVGAAALDERAEPLDVDVWARCAILAATEIAGSPLPPRVLLSGSSVSLAALRVALEVTLARLQPSVGGSAEPLAPDLLARVEWDVTPRPEDLVAVAAGTA